MKKRVSSAGCVPDPEVIRNKTEVVFKPVGLKVAANPEMTVLDIALKYGVDIEATCGGKGRCGKCRVRPEGPASDLSPLEQDLLSPGNDRDDRLACQTRLSQKNYGLCHGRQHGNAPYFFRT